jgi:hypothetical protein
MRHAEALLTPLTSQGACAYIESDVRDIDRILAEAGETLDLHQPVAVTMAGILGHITDYGEVCSIVDRLTATIPPGSFLEVQDGLVDDNAARAQGIERRNSTGLQPYQVRTSEQFHRYFDGLQLLEPGIVSITQWRPDHAQIGTPRPVPNFVGVARKRSPS